MINILVVVAIDLPISKNIFMIDYFQDYRMYINFIIKGLYE